MKLKLRPEDNPRFIEIMDHSNNLWGEMVEVTRTLEPIRIPKLWPWMAGAQLKNAQRKIIGMTEEYNGWYKKAVNFTVNPEMTVGGLSELERATSFLHYSSVLVNRINQLDAKFNENESGYRELCSISHSMKAFFWSIVFFSVSTIIAVALALVSIFAKWVSLWCRLA